MPKSPKTTANPDFSLILPCYNESSHINQSIKEILSVLNHTTYSYEIILVDDKSPDNTAQLIKTIVKTHPHIRAFFHKKNQGRGGTVQHGILKAKGKTVGFIDIDLEVAPDYIPRFIELIKNGTADVITARRYYPLSHPLLASIIRSFLSQGYLLLAKFLLHLPLDDTEAGYKFFDRKKILPVLAQTKDKHWFWDTEILARSFAAGLNVTTSPVLFLRKSSKVSTVKLIPDTIAYLKAIRKFRQDTTNSNIT